MLCVLLVLPSISPAQGVIVHPAYIRGDVSVGAEALSSILMNAAAGSILVNGTFNDAADYSLTVDAPETGVRSYVVSCRATTDAFRDVIVFRPGTANVTDGDTSVLDFLLQDPGIVEGAISLTGVGTLQSIRVEAFRQSGGVFSQAWTDHPSADGRFSFPVHPVSGLRLTGYANVLVNGITKRFDLVPDTVDVGAGGVVTVDWTLDVGDLNYASASLFANMDLRGASGVGSHLVSGNGPAADPMGRKYAGLQTLSSRFFSPRTSVLETNLNPGLWTLFAYTFFTDASYLQYPYAAYGSAAGRITLPEAETTTLNVSADAAVLTGTFELTGAVKTPEANPIYLYFRGTDTTSSLGGLSRSMVRLADSSFRNTMTEGEWKLAHNQMRFIRTAPLAGQTYRNSNLIINEHRIAPIAMAAGPNLLPGPIRYETGEVTVSVRLEGAATMNAPSISGIMNLRDSLGRVVREAQVSGNGRPEASNPAEVTFIGLAGTYTLQFRATVGGSLISIQNIPVTVTAGVVGRVDVGGPTLRVDSIGSACLSGTSLVVTGKATDDIGVASVTVNGQAATLTTTGNAADTNEVSFSATVPTALGPLRLTITATDSAGKVMEEVRSLTVDDAAPDLEVAAPESTAVVTSPRAALAGSASDDVGLGSLSFLLNGVAVPVTRTVSADSLRIDFADSLTLVEGENRLEIVATDGCGKSSVVVRTLTYIANSPPVADAGEDVLAQVGEGCRAQVKLNGWGSSDPDGDTLSYSWSAAFGTFTGASSIVSVTLGTYPVQLTVTDGNGGTAVDTFTVTVVDTTPPIIEGLEYDLNVIAQGAFGAYVDLPNPVIIDECGGVSTNDAPAVFPFGTTVVTYTILTRSGSVWPIVTRVNVLSRPAALMLTATPAQYSDTTVFLARLVSGGQPVPGKTITFRLGGFLAGTAVTGVDGSATLKHKVHHQAGTYPVLAIFPQDDIDHFNGIEATATLSVYRESATLAFTPPVKPEAYTPLVAQVTQSNDGQPGDLRRANVTFWWQKVNIDGNITNGSEWTLCDAAGSCPASIGIPGLYRIWADLRGSFYQPSSTVPTEIAVSNNDFTRVVGAGRYLAGRDRKRRKKHAHFTFTARRTAGGEYLGELVFKDNLTGVGIAGNRIDWIATDYDGNAQFQGRDHGGGRTFRVHCRNVKGVFDADKFGIEIWNGNNTSVAPVYRILNKGLSTGDITIFH